MAAHEAPASVHDHIAADYLRRRALELTDQWNADCDGVTEMDRTDWLEWEGAAYAILRELARG
jgi:hypothetical protein